DVAQDSLLRLARLFLLDGLVHRVVGGAPLRSYAVMLHERLAHGTSDLYHLLLEERGRAQRRAPGHLVRQSPEERDDGRHLRDGHDAGVVVARVAQSSGDATERLVE